MVLPSPTTPSNTGGVESLGPTIEKPQMEAFIPNLITKLSDKNERGKIESILAFGNKLLLGLSTGMLHVYTIDDPNNDCPQATLTDERSAFCSKPIEKMAVIQDANCLVVLSDSIISIFDIDSLTLDERLSQTKGATTFSICSGISETPEDSSPVVLSRLLVACKRRLLCYEWCDSEFTEFKELYLPDRIKTITFMTPNTAVCGLNSDYVIADIPSSQVSSITLPGSHSTSFTSLGFNYMGLGGRQHTPHSIKTSDNTVLLVKDTHCQFVDDQGQVLSKPVISLAIPPEAIGFSYPYLLCIFPKHIEVRNPDTFSLLQILDIPGVHAVTDGKPVYAATQHEVYRLQSTDLKQQIRMLSEKKGQLSEAISLLTLINSAFLPEKDSMLRDLQIKKAMSMFRKKHYIRAMLLLSDVSAPPGDVVNLFPPQVSGTAADLIEAIDNDKHTNNTRRSSMSSQSRTLGSSPAPTKPEEHNAGDDSQLPSPSSITTVPIIQPEWTDKSLTVAIKALLNYLADTRRKISMLKVSEVPITFQGVELSDSIYGDLEEAATLVDTTLFKCYIIGTPSLIRPLLRIHNHCDSEVVKTVLSHVEKWNELIDFYFAKQLHEEALELLYSLANASSSPEHLQGPESTVRYLQRLDNSDIDLIFKFATWPISQKESYGVDLFLEDTRESESLDRTKVLNYLQDISQPLTIKYLEYIISEKDEISPNFHTSLAVSYVSYLESTSDATTFTKLCTFLNTNPSYYRIERVLSCLPKDTKSPQLLEVKAILYGRRGLHEEALKIYTFEIRDGAKARNYCSDLYDSDLKAGRSALHLLMALYLTPPLKKEPQRLDLALELLASQGSRMSVVEIINTLPNTTGIQDIAMFLTSQIRALKKSWNNTEFEASLRKVDLVKTQESLLNLQQKSITITNTKTCRVCFKRLGHSVISVFPDGIAIHYGCTRAYQTMLDDQANQAKIEKEKRLKLTANGSRKPNGLKNKPSLTDNS